MSVELGKILNVLLNLDKYLFNIVNQNVTITYVILFVIIFSEAGLIITSFLPGDSLIFVTGTLTAMKLLNLPLIFVVLYGAVILGDTINYYIGKFLGRKILGKESSRFIRREHIEKAHIFYDKHGKLAVIMGRFIPVVRSFVAFVAGLGAMDFPRLIGYAAIGGLLRVFVFLFAGYYFGSLQIVRNNLEVAIVVVATISMSPAIVGIIKQRVRQHVENEK